MKRMFGKRFATGFRMRAFEFVAAVCDRRTCPLKTRAVTDRGYKSYFLRRTSSATSDLIDSCRSS